MYNTLSIEKAKELRKNQDI